MNLIQDHDFTGFKKYIESTENTICGRHVLYIFLKLIQTIQTDQTHKIKTKFVKYSQSEQVKKNDQNSVSYASGVAFI